MLPNAFELSAEDISGILGDDIGPLLTSGFFRASLRHWRYRTSTSFCNPDRRAITDSVVVTGTYGNSGTEVDVEL